MILGRRIPRFSLTAPVAWGVALALLAFIGRLPLLFERVEPYPGDDSFGYLKLASSLTHARFPGMIRTPGYPAFLALLSPLPGRVEDAAVIVQHLLGVAVVLVVFGVTWRLFGRTPAILAGALAAIGRPPVTIEDMVLADFLFGAIAFGGAVALAWAVRDERPAQRLLVVAGALFAVAAYVKPVGQALVLAGPLTLLVATRSVRAALRPSAIVVAAMLAVLSPWLVRNLGAYGEVGMSNLEGMTLYNRVFEVQRLPFPGGGAQERLVARLDAKARATGQRPNVFVYSGLVASGLSGDDALAVEGHVARKAIASAPLEYMVKSARLAGVGIRDLAGTPSALPPEARLASAPTVSRRVTDLALDLGGVLTKAWFVMTVALLTALAAPLLVGSRRSGSAMAFLSAWLLVLGATVLTHGGTWRYSVQLAPAAWVVSSAGLTALVLRVVRRAWPGRDHAP